MPNNPLILQDLDSITPQNVHMKHSSNGQVLEVHPSEEALVLETNRGRVRVVPITRSIFRVTYTMEPSWSEVPSLVVNVPRVAQAEADWFPLGPEGFEYGTSDLRLRIHLPTGQFSWFDAQGRLLVREPLSGGRQLEPFSLIRYDYSEADHVRAQYSADGLKVRATEGKPRVDRTSYHTKLSFEWQVDEALYGLGSHEEGTLNLRGTCQYLYQQNMKVVIPYLVSTRGYSVLWDSASPMVFRDDAFGHGMWTEADDELDYYFCVGPSMNELVAAYRFLTGSVPLLPRWAFGYIQSKERYKTQAEVVEVAEEYRRRGLPLDCIVLDWRSWTGELWGQKSFDPERFPDPPRMIDRLHDLGVKFMISVWPLMSNNGPNHVEMRESGFLLGNQSTYDAFQPGARDLYWKQANEGLFVHGVDAWWCDCTEPFEADWNGAVKPEPEARWQINREESAKYLDPEIASAYSLVHSQGLYEGQRRTTAEKRVVNLTRSGYAGQQRWSTIVWSGDVTATWETLAKQIPAGLNFCVTGNPWWTTDIGGFFVDNHEDLWFWKGGYPEGCQDPGYTELYLRWFQFGAFLPMFRSHGTDTPREVWQFGAPGQPIYDALIKTLALRYALLPYLYSAAADVSLRSGTLMRPLAFDFPNQPRLQNICDEYLFGPAFLVCPITSPLAENLGQRTVFLPDDCMWWDFWSGRFWQGGAEKQVEAPLDHIPLFVRAGSIVPWGPQVENTQERPNEIEEIRIYPGADGRFTIYQDEGDGYAYEQGSYAEWDLSWVDARQELLWSGIRGQQHFVSQRKFRLSVVGSSVSMIYEWNGTPATVVLKG